MPKKNIQGLFTLVASRNKNTKNIEKLHVESGRKKIKPVKGSFPRNFPKFKVVN